MRAEVVSMDAKHPDKEAIKRAGQILQNGGLVAFPTETVYGLGGNAPGIHENLCCKGTSVRQSSDHSHCRYVQSAQNRVRNSCKGTASGRKILAGASDHDSSKSRDRSGRNNRRS